MVVVVHCFSSSPFLSLCLSHPHLLFSVCPSVLPFRWSEAVVLGLNSDVVVVVVGLSHIMGVLRSRFYNLKVH